MKVKDLISMLQKQNQDKEVFIRFALDPEDEIGYVLEPIFVDEYYSDCAIYGEYNTTKEDCDFIGQVDLIEAYKKSKNEEQR